MEEVVPHPPDTLLGRLQRGRGAGALAVAESPDDAYPLVVECVCRDPRWDHQVERRDVYYARLVRDHDWPLDPVAGHLFAPADVEDRDTWRTGLALGVLGALTRAGRGDALDLLRRYVVTGWHWREALEQLATRARPEGLDDLAAAVLDRLSDEELVAEVDADEPPWSRWAAAHARVRAALEARAARPRALAPEPVDGLPASQLADLVRRGGRSGRLAALALGRRGDPVLLDLAEELLPQGSAPGVVGGLLRFPGGAVLDRARVWCREDRPYAGVGVWVLAERGDAGDAPLLLADVERCLAEGDWSGAVEPIEGLGRLRVPAAAPLVCRAWEAATYSHLRPRALRTLLAVDADTAAPYVEEALWDCEEAARETAARAVPLTTVTRARLAALAADPLEDEDTRAAARTR